MANSIMAAQLLTTDISYFCIEILGPQLLHHLPLKTSQPIKKALAVQHPLNYVNLFQFLVLPAVGRPGQVCASS
jgi:hypothetical protein